MKERKKSCFIYSVQPDFPNIFCKFWTTHISEVAVDTDMAKRKMGTQCTDSGQFLRWKVFNCLNKFIVLDLNCMATVSVQNKHG